MLQGTIDSNKGIQKQPLRLSWDHLKHQTSHCRRLRGLIPHASSHHHGRPRIPKTSAPNQLSTPLSRDRGHVRRVSSVLPIAQLSSERRQDSAVPDPSICLSPWCQDRSRGSSATSSLNSPTPGLDLSVPLPHPSPLRRPPVKAPTSSFPLFPVCQIHALKHCASSRSFSSIPPYISSVPYQRRILLATIPFFSV